MPRSSALSCVLTACLVLGCGSSGGGQQPGETAPDSSAGGQEPEVQTVTAAQASREAAMSVLDTTRRDACRANMRSLATAEAMYYGQFGEYGMWSSIAATGTMSNAPDLICPEGTVSYSLALTGRGYQIFCSSRPEHGSIVDGIAGWQ